MPSKKTRFAPLPIVEDDDGERISGSWLKHCRMQLAEPTVRETVTAAASWSACSIGMTSSLPPCKIKVGARTFPIFLMFWKGSTHKVVFCAGSVDGRREGVDRRSGEGREEKRREETSMAQSTTEGRGEPPRTGTLRKREFHEPQKSRMIFARDASAGCHRFG